MGSPQSDKIELQVKNFLFNKLQIDPSILYEPECNQKVQQILKDQHFNCTPDFIVNNDIDKANVEDMFFIEVNEITGGILHEDDVHSQLAKPTRLGTEQNPVRILLNPPGTNVDKSTMNKIKKTYTKYSEKRKNSINLGVILTVNEKIKNEITWENIDLTFGAFILYVLNITRILSDGNISRAKIMAKSNNIINFKFTEEFKNLGFILILGNGASSGYSFCMINRRILNKKEYVITCLQKYFNKT